MSPEMGSAHLSSFTSLRRPPDALGSTTVVRLVNRRGGAGSGRWGVLRSEI